MKTNIIILFTFSCLLSFCRGSDFSFSVKGIVETLDFRKIVDGFNAEAIKNLGYDDIKIINEDSIYRSKDDVITALSSTGRNHKSLWSQELEEIFKDFKKDADKYGLEIKQSSLDALYSMRLVDKFSKPTDDQVGAVCIRTNFKYWNESTVTVDRIYRIEVSIEKYNEFKELIKNENKGDKKTYEYVLKKLIYHKLMHCVLHLGHLPDEVAYDGDIMHPLYSKSPLSQEEWEEILIRNFNIKYINKMTYID
jgi:hypothetical protein